MINPTELLILTDLEKLNIEQVTKLVKNEDYSFPFEIEREIGSYQIIVHVRFDQNGHKNVTYQTILVPVISKHHKKWRDMTEQDLRELCKETRITSHPAVTYCV